jgi:hypothetical protein
MLYLFQFYLFFSLGSASYPFVVDTSYDLVVEYWKSPSDSSLTLMWDMVNKHIRIYYLCLHKKLTIVIFRMYRLVKIVMQQLR